jgi:hypothetical protein
MTKYLDAGLLTHADGLGDLRAHGILNADKANQNELLRLVRLRRLPVAVGVVIKVRVAYRNVAQGLLRHLKYLLLVRFPIRGGERLRGQAGP